MNRRRLFAALLLVLPALSVEAQGRFETFIMAGDAAPGLGEGVTFHSAGTPILNESGQAVVGARVTGPGIVTDESFGFWSDAGGSLEWVARTGVAMPGLPAGTSVWRYNNGAYSQLMLNNQGQIATIARLQGAGVTDDNDLVLLVERNGELEVAAREDDAVPGQAGDVRYDFMLPSAFNALGEVAFRADLKGADTTPGTKYALLTLGPAGLVHSFREGEQAPGIEPGVVFDDNLPFNQPGLLDTGGMVFYSEIDGPGIHGFNNEAVFHSATGGTTVVLRDGDLPPGDVAGSGYQGIISIGTSRTLPIDRQGHVAFTAGWQDATNTSRGGVVVEGPVNPRVVAYADEQLPGTVPSTTIRSINFNSITMNGRGDVAFSTTIEGPDVVIAQNWTVLLREYDGQLDLIAREGDPLPMIGPGYSLGGISSSSILMNDAGQVLFEGSIDGPNLHSGNRAALFATTPSGELVLLLRENDPFDANDDPLIEDIHYINHFDLDFTSRSNGVDGIGSVFTDDGRFAVGLNFGVTFGAFIGQVTDHVEGDVTGDGLVNHADHAIIVGNWGDAVGKRAIGSGDLSLDGMVGPDDLAILLANLAAPLPGDFDGDGDIDGVDLGQSFANFTGPNNGPPGNPLADLDGDDDVDGVDLAQVFGVFTGPLSPATVPEPGSVVLIVFVGLAAMHRRRLGSV